MPRVNPWDLACRLAVIRGNHIDDPERLEPGVNFFVLMLEQIGCTPIWSCEGHPHGFHILFRGFDAAARAINEYGYFTVSFPPSSTGSDYEMSFLEQEWKRPDLPWSDARRIELLRYAALAWTAGFGDLRILDDVRKHRGKGALVA